MLMITIVVSTILSKEFTVLLGNKANQAFYHVHLAFSPCKIIALCVLKAANH